jgi:hypothetical protein
MPFKTQTTIDIQEPLDWGPVYLTEEEWAELEIQQTIPVEPTESIKRAAELIRRLYGKKWR